MTPAQEEILAMRPRIRKVHAALAVVASLAVAGPAAAQEPAPAGPVADALPFTLTIAPKCYPASLPPLPGLQGFLAADLDGKIFVVGGRAAGLHAFNPAPAQNFPTTTANTNLTVIDPQAGTFAQFDVSKLPANLADPLMATNQQGWYDRDRDLYYLNGGYGLDSTTGEMTTFNSLMRIPLRQAASIITSDQPDAAKAAALSKVIQVLNDDRLAVTGGALKGSGDRLYLIFGQKFVGSYYAFGTGKPFVQEYTERISVITLQPDAFRILSIVPLTSQDPSQPYHRRDGSVVDDVDPATGAARFTAFGGVFKVGTTSGYTEPISIQDRANAPIVALDATVQQKFSQYECPVISVHDEAGRAVYSTFCGGISHHYFNLTPMQKAVYDIVTKEGRGDGVPFIADVTTLVRKGDGSSAQFILPEPMPAVPIPPAVIQQYFSIPGNAPYKVQTTNIMGSSVEFIPDSRLIAAGKSHPNGVLRLDGFRPGESAAVGWIYGGIVSVFPYALTPSNGTFAGDTLFEVTLTRTPSAAFPASAAHAADPTGDASRRP